VKTIDLFSCKFLFLHSVSNMATYTIQYNIIKYNSISSLSTYTYLPVIYYYIKYYIPILNRVLIEKTIDSVYAQATVEADKKFGRIARRTRLFNRKNI